MTDKKKTYYELAVERVYEKNPLQRHHYVQIRQSKAFMDEYYSGRIDLKEMAAKASMRTPICYLPVPNSACFLR